jgi:hypothetical protein
MLDVELSGEAGHHIELALDPLQPCEDLAKDLATSLYGSGNSTSSTCLSRHEQHEGEQHHRHTDHTGD